MSGRRRVRLGRSRRSSRAALLIAGAFAAPLAGQYFAFSLHLPVGDPPTSSPEIHPALALLSFLTGWYVGRVCVWRLSDGLRWRLLLGWLWLTCLTGPTMVMVLHAACRMGACL